MGYNKFIRYGNFLELYEYERDIVPRVGGGKRVRTTPADMADSGANGEDKLRKRQDNSRRASLAFRRIVACNLGGSARPLLVTLTYRENFTDLKGAYRHFSSFIQALRHKYGKAFRYICVPEFQKRGAVHFHALFWGLPSEVFLLERKNRTLAGLWGRGFVYLKETDGNEKLSFYLAKYMAKAFTDPRLKNQKSYVASRNVERPIVGKGFAPVWPILDEFVGNDDPPVVDREYNTRYLGKGRYRLFKVKV
jgi:hypothetical protein